MSRNAFTNLKFPHFTQEFIVFSFNPLLHRAELAKIFMFIALAIFLISRLW